MRLRYKKTDGTPMEFHLGEQPITIGRSPDADIVLLDEKVSRIHCGVRLWDGDFYVKDLKSKNGTFVNGARSEAAKLRPSDLIRIGSTTFTFEQDPEVGQETALEEINEEMARGKGYTTILRELVDDTGEKADEAAAAPEGAHLPSRTTPPSKTPGLHIPPRKAPAKIILKRRPE